MMTLKNEGENIVTAIISIGIFVYLALLVFFPARSVLPDFLHFMVPDFLHNLSLWNFFFSATTQEAIILLMLPIFAIILFLKFKGD